jgi:serine acetyltransferase
MSAWARFVASVRADHAQQLEFDQRYTSDVRESGGALARDLVQRIGLQMMAAYRLMRLMRELGVPVAPKIASRMIRFFYGSDIHWNAQLADGVTIVHGMGLAISGAAKVGSRCLIFHNVTLGEAIDPKTRATGAPTIEDDVHIGPGATLLGPITIGSGSKIMAGTVVTQSVPRNSLVEAPTPFVISRVRPRDGGSRADADPRVAPLPDRRDK